MASIPNRSRTVSLPAAAIAASSGAGVASTGVQARSRALHRLGGQQPAVDAVAEAVGGSAAPRAAAGGPASLASSTVRPNSSFALGHTYTAAPGRPCANARSSRRT